MVSKELNWSVSDTIKAGLLQQQYYIDFKV